MNKVDEAQAYFEQLIEQINHGLIDSNKLKHSNTTIKDAFGNNHTIQQHSHSKVKELNIDAYQARYLVQIIVDAAVDQIKKEFSDTLFAKIKAEKPK